MTPHNSQWALPIKRPRLQLTSPHDAELGESLPPSLPCGLHLLTGPKASGKTVTALALAKWYEACGVSSFYDYVAEPRSPGAAELVSDSGKWEAHLKGTMLAARKNDPYDQGKAAAFLVEDSLTYVLTRHPKVELVQAKAPDVIFPGGLRPIDALAALILDDIAAQAGVVLVGTLNSELYPHADKLEGAVEGKITLAGRGMFSYQNRDDRQPKPVVVPDRYVRLAVKALGYPEFTSSSSLFTSTSQI